MTQFGIDYDTELPTPALFERMGTTFSVPNQSLINVEHPCIVSDLSEAVKSLGGPFRVKEVNSINLCECRASY